MKRFKVVGVVGSLMLVPFALAQYVPPTMDPIPEVIDWASASQAIMLAGATLLAIVFAISIGFKLVHKLKARITGDV